MLTGEDRMELFGEGDWPPAGAVRLPEVVQELQAQAQGDMPAALRSVVLFTWLRRFSGRPDLVDCLWDLQSQLSRPDVMGTRLLTAWLDVVAPGNRLVPLVQDFSHSRRLGLNLVANPPLQGSVLESWEHGLHDLTRACVDYLGEICVTCRPDDTLPGQETPWPIFRKCLRELLARRDETGRDWPRHQQLMANMLRLETDAWQERLSGLAGRVNPFQTERVWRILPRLNQADSDVRDLRELTLWLEEGDSKSAFVRQQSRINALWEGKEISCLDRTLKDHPELAGLKRLYGELQAHPVPLPCLAYAVGRLMSLQDHLLARGLAAGPLTALDALTFVQGHFFSGEVAMPVDPVEVNTLGAVLEEAEERGGWPLTGLRLVKGQLVLDLAPADTLDVHWPHGLPMPTDIHPENGQSLLNVPQALAEVNAVNHEDPEPETDDSVNEAQSQTNIKNLVMTNLMSVSLLLGFLRNPRIIAIPGLVAEVAQRTRNPQIIETIAVDRSLYTGFANREVPRLCLLSPCNVSVKILRKFIHVKYVSKVDLRRMAMDKAGIRKEVSREIEKYLEALS